MVVVRWILALATVAYALWNAMPPTMTALFKLHKLPSTMAADSQRFIPMMQVTPWWQVAVWWLADLLYLFAAFRLVSRPREAFVPALIAVVLDVGAWIVAKQRPVYDKTFTPFELQLDYYIIGCLVVGLVLYGLCSRVKRKRTQVAVLSE